MHSNIYSVAKMLFVTSTKEVIFSPGFVRPSVCLFVNEITQKNLLTDFDEIFSICLKR